MSDVKIRPLAKFGISHRIKVIKDEPGGHISSLIKDGVILDRKYAGDKWIYMISVQRTGENAAWYTTYPFTSLFWVPEDALVLFQETVYDPNIYI